MKNKAVIFDQMQFLYEKTGFNDHQVHSVIRFEGKLDAAVLEEAVRLLLTVVPELARVYVDRGGSSYWEEREGHDTKSYFSIVSKEEDFDEFTFSRTCEKSGPQIRVCLLNGTRDAVSVIVNHMICDGAGMKQCLYLLSSLYSRLLQDKDYVPDVIRDGDRSMRCVLRRIPVLTRIRILLFGQKSNNQNSLVEFPLSREGDAKPFIASHEINGAIFCTIREQSKNDNVTINDVLLTAYFRTLSHYLGLSGKEFGIPIMIDMRKYLEEASVPVLTNLSSTDIIRASAVPGEPFSQTLQRVSAAMRIRKENYLGINAFVKLNLLYRLAGKWSYRILEKKLQNPRICMTNIGILDEKKLVFGNTPVAGAFLCGSIKFRPHFQMSASTFGNTLTLCINLYGTREDKETAGAFLAEVAGELAGYASGGSQSR
jgi:NRPS condensation-like uncharacterized protein